jgi:hypothetical protein
MNNKIKVLFITGRGRSGSTILDIILGQIEGFFSVGQLRTISRRSLIQNRSCGCGVPVDECEFWREVLDSAFPDDNGRANIHRVVRLLKNYPHKLHIPYFLLPGRRILVKNLFRDYLKNLGKLYQSIYYTTGCKVIVDSSKFPPYGFALDLLPSVELYILHLVRDPRAVVYSWWRKQREVDATDGIDYMRRENVVYSAFLWGLWNLMPEHYWRRFPDRYMLLRYEDFVAAPKQTIESILSLVKERRSDLPFVGEHSVKLGSNHTTTGNPSRFSLGTVEIRSNSEWERKMRQSHKKVVTALTWPLLHRYGYAR